MDKLPPPPPPPPPGRGRPDGPQPPRDRQAGRQPTAPADRVARARGRAGCSGSSPACSSPTIFVPSLLPDDSGNELTYSEFLDQVVAGEVTSVEVNRHDGKISGELDNGDKFFTNGGSDRGLSDADEPLLKEQGRRRSSSSRPSSNWLLNVLGLMLPVHPDHRVLRVDAAPRRTARWAT